MEWYIIEYLYPSAYKLFTDKMFPNIGLLSTTLLKNYDLKKLYNFFDGQGIYLNVEIILPQQWCYHISRKDNYYVKTGNKNFQTRESCEVDGFTNCFLLLDKKINETKREMSKNEE